MEFRVEGLTKRYQKKVVFCEFSCKFGTGVTVLLGANGAGKSTLLNILSTALDMDMGKIFWNDLLVTKNLKSYRASLGYVPQGIVPYPSFTAGQFLEYICQMKEIAKDCIDQQVEKALAVVHLTNMRNIKIAKLSGGMKQRLVIAQGILGNPDILLLDEPTVGLDPKERLQFKQYLHGVAQEKVVILSTHIISDAEDLADRVLLLKEGKVVLQGEVDEILEQRTKAQIPQTLDDVFMELNC